VEGSQGETLSRSCEQALDTLLHLAGSFVGKGDRQDVVRAHAQSANQVGDALGEDAGLAGAGTRQDEYGTRGGSDSLLLLWVESFEEVHRLPILPGVRRRCKIGKRIFVPRINE
jgi:hypothetical protein